MSLLDKLSKSSKKPFDISVIHLSSEDGSEAAGMSLLNNGGGVCYGLQKLCQKFIMLLLTPKGTVKYFPLKGSSFVSMVQGAQNETQVRSAFILALSEVKKQITNEETDTMLDSEKFGSATLSDVSFWFDTISITIRLISKDGNSHDVILPIYSI